VPEDRGGYVTVQAYVLIQARAGKSTDVAGAIAGLEGVISAADTSGPYDVIAKVEAETLDALGEMVVSSLQLVDGVVRTLTCPIVNF
jgi:DNA-binding Lrp family transcriptional regulator